MKPIPVTLTEQRHPRPADSALRFGNVFTDHMARMEYDEDRGWHDLRIVPYAPFTLDPACCVLHYAQAVFDGLKAFRGADDRIRIFRPDKHAERLRSSCERLCIPPPAAEDVIASIENLVDTDRDWVPRLDGTSLYIRPTVIATETFLGVHPSRSYLYYVILSPVGTYYAEGLDPVKILATDTHVRAVRGGLGEAKTAGNYAASLSAAREAQEQGYTQVLWLDGVHREYLDEVGTMNIMVQIGDEVITPPLAGTILAGVTRDSVLTLLRDWGIKATERPVSIHEIFAAHENGTLREMWGTGTAAVVAPVGELGFQGRRITIADGRTGPLTRRLYDAIVAIQRGQAEDRHRWIDLLPAERARTEAA